MLQQVNLLIRLRRTIFVRSLKQVPLVYKILISLLIVGALLFLSKVELELTWKSTVITLGIHLFLCSRIKYSREKNLYLKQYKHVLMLSYFIDFVLISISFLLINVWLGLTTIVLSLLWATYRSNPLEKSFSLPVLPSRFFMTGSFLWHAKSRYFLPASWILIIMFIITGFIHQNFNLAMVAFVGGVFFSLLITVFQMESYEFIQTYITPEHFIRQSIKETLLNSVVFMSLPAIILLLLFPQQVIVALLTFVALLLIGLNMVFVKYALYPSLPIALFLLLVSMALIAALLISIYGAILIPLYYILIFYLYRNNVRKIISYEKSNSKFA